MGILVTQIYRDAGLQLSTSHLLYTVRYQTVLSTAIYVFIFLRIKARFYDRIPQMTDFTNFTSISFIQW